jgi:hypothetical protein
MELMLRVNSDVTEICETCVSGKQTKVKASKPLERILSDVVGPIDPLSYNGNKYILTLLDDCTHFTVVFPMKSEAHVLQYIKLYVGMATPRFWK